MKDSIIVDSIGKVKDMIIHNNVTIHSNKIKDSQDTIFLMPESLLRILIPAVIALLVFIVGQLIVWYRNQKGIQNETKHYKRIILGWAELIKNPIEQQVAECRDLSDRIKISENLVPEKFNMVKMLANKVDNISIDKYISTFLLNTTNSKNEDDYKNEKMTFNLISQYSYLSSIEGNISETYKSYQTEINKIMEEWNEKFYILTKIIDDWTQKINEGDDLFDFRQNVRRISVNWVNTAPNGRSTMTYSMSQLVTPLSSLVDVELKSNMNNEYAYQLSETLQYLRIVDLKWRTCNNGFGIVFHNLAKNIETSLNALNEANEYFSTKTKTKNIFDIGESK